MDKKLGFGMSTPIMSTHITPTPKMKTPTISAPSILTIKKVSYAIKRHNCLYGLNWTQSM